MNRAALFLDRDGVINADHGHVGRREEFDFLPGIFELVKSANAEGYVVLVVTNQAGIARGLYSERDFRELTIWMMGEFESRAARIDCVYYCPFHPQHGTGFFRRESAGRKPAPGMFLRAAEDWSLDLAASIMVGDKLTDVVAAAAAGITNLFIYDSSASQEGASPISDFREVLPRLRERRRDVVAALDSPKERIVCVG
jgi:D-glycero-D-manno-heptose 1,7-bisphosphate phosphatase